MALYLEQILSTNSPQGVQGTQGTQGLQGPQASQGTQGLQGNQGTQGLQGPQASQGIQGTQGFTGAGTQGTQGVQGFQGTQGSQGIQGNTGAGTQGASGTSGSQGIQGIQGIAGTQGAACGAKGSNQQVQYNNAGSMGGAAGLLFVSGSNTTIINIAQANLANIVTLNVSANISNAGNLLVTQNTFTGNLSVSGAANISGILNVTNIITTTSNIGSNGTHYIATYGYVGGACASVANNPAPFINYNYTTNTTGGISAAGMPQYIGAYWNSNTANKQFWGIGQCNYGGNDWTAGGTGNVRIGVVGIDTYGHYTFINDVSVRMGNLYATGAVVSPTFNVTTTLNAATITTTSNIGSNGTHYIASYGYVGGRCASVANNPAPFINYNYTTNTTGGISAAGMPQYIGAYYNANTANTQFWGIGQCNYGGTDYAAGGTGNVRIGVVGIDTYGHYTFINDVSVRMGNAWVTNAISAASMSVSGTANISGILNTASITISSNIGSNGTHYIATYGYVGGACASVANNPAPFINYNYTSNTYGGASAAGMPQYIGAYNNANTANKQFWGIGQCNYGGYMSPTGQGNVRIGIVGIDNAYGHYTFIADANVRMGNLYATGAVVSPTFNVTTTLNAATITTTSNIGSNGTHYIASYGYVGGSCASVANNPAPFINYNYTSNTYGIAGMPQYIGAYWNSNTANKQFWGIGQCSLGGNQWSAGGTGNVRIGVVGIDTYGHYTFINDVSVRMGNAWVTGAVNTASIGVSGNTANVGSTSSITANGFSRLTNGLLFQWGNVSATSTNTVVAFPATFTSLFQVTATGVLLDGSATGTNLNVMPIITTSNTRSFNVRINSATANTVNWMAIGI
jgi:hypothetical protein